MKLLPICINGRTDYMVDFESNVNSNEAFAIASDIDGILLSFYRYRPANNPTGPCAARRANAVTGLMLQKDSGPETLFLSSIEESLVDDELVLSIKLCNEQNTNPKFSIRDFNYNPDRSCIGFNRRNDFTAVKVEFKFESDIQAFYIYLAPGRQIRDAVIDCGSEATQMAMFNRIETYNINDRLPILSDMLSHFGYNNDDFYDEDYADFVQAERSGGVTDKNLYRSVFFAKKRIASDEVGENNIYPIDGECETENSVLRMCITKNDLESIRKTHFQLFNMKISAFGGIELPKIIMDGLETSIKDTGNNFFYRKYLTEFLNVVLKRFCHVYNQQDNRAARVLCLHMLVPNVYTPKRTSEFISDVRKDLLKLVENNERYKNLVRGVCVDAVSESDASLVGAISLQRHRNFKDGTYLVLDAGKGTLDFSITKYEGGYFKNIMKSGFVGASAAINYGLLLDLLEEFLRGCCRVSGDAELKKFIFENILGKTKSGRGLEGGDLCLLNDLVLAVDNYKIRFSQLPKAGTATNVPVAKIDEIRLSTFVEWVRKRMEKVATDNVDAIMATIINSVYQKIVAHTKQKIDYVVFAGRGFLYAPFKDEMFKMLKKLFSNIVETEFLDPMSAANNKNVCLFVASAISEGRYNNHLLPIPYEIDRDVAMELLNSHYSDNDIVQQTQKNTGLSAFLDRIQSLVQGVGIQDTASAQAQVVGTLPVGESNDFVVGYNINVAPNISVVIGGTFYNLGVTVAPGVAKLFYSNGDILLRDVNNFVHTLRESADLSRGLSFPSLFPFCDVMRANDVYIQSKQAVDNAACLVNAPVKNKETEQQGKEDTISAKDRLEELKNR